MSSLTDPLYLSDDDVRFNNVFNKNRSTLAGFASCITLTELSIVRDGFYLGMASELCKEEYDYVKVDIITNFGVGVTVGSETGFQRTVEAARKSAKWDELVESVKTKALICGTDLEKDVWEKLESGRMEWLQAAGNAHTIKVTLRAAVEADGEAVGDVSDAMMVWMYALALNIKSLAGAVNKWAAKVEMEDKKLPLKGYKPEKWDARLEEWKTIDLRVQEVAVCGGMDDIKAAWKA